MNHTFNVNDSVVVVHPKDGIFRAKVIEVFSRGCWVKPFDGIRRYYAAEYLTYWKPCLQLEEPFPGGDTALTEVIDTQPKKDMKYDADKPRMDLLLSGCPLALEAVSSILTFGAKKYSAHSWQTVERGDERYLAALLRHLTAHAKGEKLDPESGMSHLAHAACNAMFILELELKK